VAAGPITAGRDLATQPAPPSWRATGVASCGWFAAALVLYVAGGASGLVWGDSSKLTLYALAAHLPSLNPGDHAGWTLLAAAWLRLLGGDPVVMAHRLSALAGAVAVAAAAALALRRGAGAAVAHTTAALLLVAHPLWWSAGVAETYAPAVAAALLGALAATCGGAWMLLAGLAWGLAVSIHVVALALVVPLAWTLARRRLPLLAPGAVAGLAPVWLAFFIHRVDPLTSFAATGAGTWRWHLGTFVDLTRAPGNAAIVVALVLFALGPFGFAALYGGRHGGATSRVWWLSLAALGGLLLVYARFRLHLLVVFPVVGLVLARPVRLGLAARVAHVAAQAAIYVAAPLLLAATGHASLGVRVLPHRDNARYFLDPIRRGDRGAETYVAEAGACLAADMVVIADFNVGAVLRLAQVARAWRADLTLEPVAVDVALAAPDPAAALSAAARAALATRPAAFADTWEPYYRLHGLDAGLCVDRCGPVAPVRCCGRDDGGSNP
jgi:hypothetical protein